MQPRKIEFLLIKSLFYLKARVNICMIRFIEIVRNNKHTVWHLKHQEPDTYNIIMRYQFTPIELNKSWYLSKCWWTSRLMVTPIYYGYTYEKILENNLDISLNRKVKLLYIQLKYTATNKNILAYRGSLEISCWVKQVKPQKQYDTICLIKAKQN